MSRILLLEDDLVLSQNMKIALQASSFDVVIENDRKEAFKRASNEQFDLYLIDANTPYFESFDFLEQIRKDGDKTPAFFVTALIDLGSLSRVFDTGVDDYIKKPFDMNELIIRISSIIKKRYDFLEYGNLIN